MQIPPEEIAGSVAENRPRSSNLIAVFHLRECRAEWWTTIFGFSPRASRAISITSSWPSAEGIEIKFIVFDGCMRLQWVAGGENGWKHEAHVAAMMNRPTLRRFAICPSYWVPLSIGLSAIKRQASRAFVASRVAIFLPSRSIGFTNTHITYVG